MPPRPFRLAAAIALLAATAPPAAAQSRPDTLAMTCAQARALVLRNGAIVLGSGPGIYERYVATPAQCDAGDSTPRAFAPTRDNPACYVGERCVPRGGALPSGSR